MFDARQLEPALTERETILRDRFVNEYLKDFDAYKACLRLGFQAAYALQWMEILTRDGYVQRAIDHFTQMPFEDDEALKAQTQRRLMQIGLRGSDTASVTALRLLSDQRGWSKQDGGGDGVSALTEVFKDLAQRLPT